jgi:hypothetical protein
MVRQRRAVEEGGREIEHAVHRAEQSRMAGRAAKRIGVLVVHLAPHHAAAPGVALGGGTRRRIGPEGEALGQRLVDQGLTRKPLDGDAEQEEVDVGIDRRSRRPHPLQDEGPQGLRVLAVGVEGLHRRQMRLVREALAEGEPALGRVHVVLAQIRDRLR